MDKSLIPMLFFTSSLITTFLTAPLSRLSGSGVRFRNRWGGGGWGHGQSASGWVVRAAGCWLAAAG
jgi:hypothetical protein